MKKRKHLFRNSSHHNTGQQSSPELQTLISSLQSSVVCYYSPFATFFFSVLNPAPLAFSTTPQLQIRPSRNWQCQPPTPCLRNYLCIRPTASINKRCLLSACSSVLPEPGIKPFILYLNMCWGESWWHGRRGAPNLTNSVEKNWKTYENCSTLQQKRVLNMRALYLCWAGKCW